MRYNPSAATDFETATSPPRRQNDPNACLAILRQRLRVRRVDGIVVHSLGENLKYVSGGAKSSRAS